MIAPYGNEISEKMPIVEVLSLTSPYRSTEVEPVDDLTDALAEGEETVPRLRTPSIIT